MKQHVSAYSEAIIRCTNVSYRRLIAMRVLWQMMRYHHIGLIKQIGETFRVGGC